MSGQDLSLNNTSEALPASMEYLTIKITDGTCSLFFKTKRTAPLQSAMCAFYERFLTGKQLLANSQVKFRFAGSTVFGADSPDNLGMQDRDVLEVRHPCKAVPDRSSLSFMESSVVDFIFTPNDHPDALKSRTPVEALPSDRLPVALARRDMNAVPTYFIPKAAKKIPAFILRTRRPSELSGGLSSGIDSQDFLERIENFERPEEEMLAETTDGDMPEYKMEVPMPSVPASSQSADSCAGEYEASERRMSMSSDSIASLPTGRDYLKTDLMSVKKLNEHVGKAYVALGDKTIDVSHANHALRRQFDDLIGTITDLRTENKDLKKANDNLTESNTVLQAKAPAAEKDKTSLKQANDNLTESNTVLQDQAHAAEKANTGLQAQLTDVQAGLAYAQKLYQDLGAKLGSCEVQKIRLEDENKALKQDVQTLKGENDELRAAGAGDNLGLKKALGEMVMTMKKMKKKTKETGEGDHAGGVARAEAVGVAGEFDGDEVDWEMLD